MLSYPFIGRALAVGVLISFCAALLGVILVLKKYSLIGHGLGDVGFASTALAVALGLNATYVSLPIVVIASLIIMFVSQKTETSGDAAIGMIATGSLAVGVVITALSNGFNIDVYNYMFGSILAMSDSDVIFSAVLSAFVIILFAVMYNRLFLVTYDEVYAKSIGINVSFYRFMISFLTAVTVVLGMRMMGSMLISSLIIFPAMTSKKLVKSFKGVVLLSAAVSVTCFILGIILSFALDLPTGASVVIMNLAAFTVATVVSKCKSR